MDQIPLKRISIQVALDGYSFKIQQEGRPVLMSGWNSPDSVFDADLADKEAAVADISVLTPKVSLTPSAFFKKEETREMLERTVDLEEGEPVSSISLPEFSAELLYSLHPYAEALAKVQDSLGERVPETILPEMYFILQDILKTDGYNRIIASYADSHLHLAIAQGKNLLLCNVYEAADFTTAEYFIFLAMRKLQLNPEVTVIRFRTPLSETEEMSLYRYFKGVERI